MTPEEFREHYLALNQKELRYRTHPEDSLYPYDPEAARHPFDFDRDMQTIRLPGPDDIVLARQNRHSIVPLHRHSFVEMNYLYSGSATELLEGERVELSSGDVSIFDTDVIHTVLPLGDDDVLLNFYLPLERIEQLLGRHAQSQGAVAELLWESISQRTDHSRCLVIRTQEMPEFRTDVERAFCEFLDPQPGSDVALECLIALLVTDLTRCWQTQGGGEGAGGSGRVGDILRFVERNCTDCSLSSVATHFGYSPSHVSRLISQQTGRSFKHYVTRARLRRAGMLLRTEEMPVSAVAEACGWKNRTIFYQRFQERFGCTPKEYRDAWTHQLSERADS